MSHETMHATLERIAREELEITTLESRHSDQEDFHTLAVWEIATVMERAYQAGFEASRNEPFVRFWFCLGEHLPDGGTRTVDTFDRFAEACKAAVRLGRPCFVDRWRSTCHTPGEGIDEPDPNFEAIHYPL
jgi:hypothetical protein